MDTVVRGAESVVRMSEGAVIKERVKKGYRLSALDELLRKKRTRTEARLLREAARIGLDVPRILEEKQYTLRIELVPGSRVRDALGTSTVRQFGEAIGAAVAGLHRFDIIHGDLTTSNMMVSGKKLFLIDFGLGFFSRRAEDKANDLYLLHEALESTHHEVLESAWKIILKAYRENYGEADAVLGALEKVQKRRRYS
ncbi:MAG: Kae1-associated serine/threonine protein kinase [Candidatus Aenigmarchaeota archaeon]|nr:Kae1-associated serine/threonine protein kinase [Candidatus Aenigmarchaeota archaeon]